MEMEQTEGSETSAYKIQTPENYPEENRQQNSYHCARSITVLKESQTNDLGEETFLRILHVLRLVKKSAYALG
jgi:hypothetical protein